MWGHRMYGVLSNVFKHTLLWNWSNFDFYVEGKIHNTTLASLSNIIGTKSDTLLNDSATGIEFESNNWTAGHISE